MIWRSFLIVLSVIIIGVTVAEKQVNSLTQRQDITKAFNISEQRGIYSGYLLGYEYSTSFSYPVGKIYNNDQELVMKIQDFVITVPLRVQVDLSSAMALAYEGKDEFIDKSMKTKQNFEKYLKLWGTKIRISL
jgi:hypothetical protein